MKLKVLLAILFSLQGFTTGLKAQDSLWAERDSLYSVWRFQSDTMTVRSWQQLLRLHNSSKALIKTDNRILTHYEDLGREMRNLSKANDSLILENSALAIELSELRSESGYLHKAVLYSVIIVAALLLTIVILAFLLFRTRQYNRQLIGEVEELYSNRETQQSSRQNEESITRLEAENRQLKELLGQLREEHTGAVDKLKEEIKTRRRTEKELKGLITELQKKKS
ncbi:MAG: hypothetical protein Kow00127_10650 [Bacteroidales bacterium]